MSAEQEIVANTKATMVMAGLPLPEDSVRRIESYMNGKSTLAESIDDLLERYKVA